MGAPLVCSTRCERAVLKAAGRDIGEAHDPPADPHVFFEERRLIAAAGEDAAAMRRAVLILRVKRRALPHFDQEEPK